MNGHGTIKKVLGNGITVLIEENHTAPVAACNFWIKSGSAGEGEKEKGISHFIEHMMFKGTQKRTIGDIDREIKNLGGYNNAFTSYDAVNYVIVLPSEHVKRALEIEYDALTASVFDKEETDKERQVILEELKRGLDSPNTFLWQKLMKLSFDGYYADPIIGYEELLKEYSRDKVYEYYKKHYRPDNIIVAVTGDVDAAELMPYIEGMFGKMDGSFSDGDSGKLEIKERGLRYETYAGSVESRYLGMAFMIPDALSPELPAIEILARILGGSESSLLNRIIKEEKQLVDSVSADMFAGRHGGVLAVSAVVREGKYAETVSEILKLLGRVRSSGVAASDVQKVKADIIREHEKDKMKAENAAMNLGYYEMLGDYGYYAQYMDRLYRVLDSDVNKAAAEYLLPEGVSMVLYYPDKKEKEFAAYKDKAKIAKLMAVKAGAEKGRENEATGRKLKNGAMLIHKKLTAADIVSMKFVFKGGVIAEAGAWQGMYKGITNLMLNSMFKGTTKRTAAEIAEETDALGAVIDSDLRKDCFGFEVETTSANFEKVMELFSDILLNPLFDIEEVRKEKQDIVNGIVRLPDSPASYAVKIFNENFFEWHPYGDYPPGTVESVRRIPVKKLPEWHDMNIAPQNLIISCVGNIEEDRVEAALAEYFKKWPAGRDLKVNLPVKITGAKKIIRQDYDKNQSHIVIGFLGPKAGGDDYYSFRVLDTVLSGSMDSRLFTEIRDKRNLCYSIYSTFDRNIENGAFKIYIGTSPENEDTAVEEIFKVLSDLKKSGITAAELESAKNYIKGMFAIGMQDYMSQADSYAMYEFWGVGYKKVDSFPARIDKVTRADVAAAIDEYFTLKKYTQVTVGPAKKTEKKAGKKK